MPQKMVAARRKNPRQPFITFYVQTACYFPNFL